MRAMHLMHSHEGCFFYVRWLVNCIRTFDERALMPRFRWDFIAHLCGSESVSSVAIFFCMHISCTFVCVCAHYSLQFVALLMLVGLSQRTTQCAAKFVVNFKCHSN